MAELEKNHDKKHRKSIQTFLVSERKRDGLQKNNVLYNDGGGGTREKTLPMRYVLNPVETYCDLCDRKRKCEKAKDNLWVCIVCKRLYYLIK